MSKRIPLFTQDGFIICFEALPEELDMRKHFIKECKWTEKQFKKIENFSWFCAEVSAWKDGKKLGSDYLGGCCYEHPEEFYTTFRNDYFKDMVKDAISEAKKAK